MPLSIIAKVPKPIAIAMGDPAGIGPELLAKAWMGRADYGLAPFFAVGCRSALEAIWQGPVIQISTPDEAYGCFEQGLPLVQVDALEDISAGQPSLAGARVALDALELATGLARSGAASALVTGPVSKTQLYAIGFSHPGQTEFVAERCGISEENCVMMLVSPTLRTVPLTIHLPLEQVASHINSELIMARARILARGLQRDFGIERPRIAVAGLNPHAGENGELGRTELDVIAPAISALRAEDMDIFGPLSADSLFHARARAHYDVALCMYHDQALIPLKTLHFDEGVNMTLGLPIIRTSPDHGTAFDIAGQWKASPDAMVAAIRTAQDCALRRLRES